MTDAITAESAHQATSKRKPPEVDVEVLEIENLPDHSEPWEKIQRDFLPVHFLLLTVKDCEFLSCLSFLKEGFVKSNRKPLGIVYFGNIRDNKHEEVKVAVTKCNMGSSTPGGSRVVVPNCTAFAPYRVRPFEFAPTLCRVRPHTFRVRPHQVEFAPRFIIISFLFCKFYAGLLMDNNFKKYF